MSQGLQERTHLHDGRIANCLEAHHHCSSVQGSATLEARNLILHERASGRASPLLVSLRRYVSRACATCAAAAAAAAEAVARGKAGLPALPEAGAAAAAGAAALLLLPDAEGVVGEAAAMAERGRGMGVRVRERERGEARRGWPVRSELHPPTRGTLRLVSTALAAKNLGQAGLHSLPRAFLLASSPPTLLALTPGPPCRK